MERAPLEHAPGHVGVAAPCSVNKGLREDRAQLDESSRVVSILKKVHSGRDGADQVGGTPPGNAPGE